MKKIIRNILMLAIVSAAAIGCDKIDENNYIVYSGASGEWFDGTPVEDHSQRAFLEKYTGVRCNNCPTADQVIAAASSQYGDKLVVVSIHDSNTLQRPIGDSPDMRCPDGDTWSKALGVFGAGEYPMALVNRKPSGNGWERFNPVGGVSTQIDEALAAAPSVALSLSADRVDANIDIDVYIEYLSTLSGKQTVTLLLIEDGIIATQKMPNHSDSAGYQHNHILRDVITDLWGADIDANGQAGTCRKARFSYTATNQEWNLDRCHIIALVSDKESKKVYNSAQCSISAEK
ncbi:MAG: Omp28 family outer membrane lipoprotein [Bacteroidales bacterium]|nr:Omp28 family outer membrane lipoprotein [Bacteroidales bacterium]